MTGADVSIESTHTVDTLENELEIESGRALDGKTICVSLMEADDEDLRKGQVPLRNRVVMCTIEPGLREIISGIERSGKERILRKAKVVLEPL